MPPEAASSPEVAGRRGAVSRHLPLLFLAAGLCLSALDWAGVCTEACAETALYRFFGFPVPPLGVLYFAASGAACLARERHRSFRLALSLLLFGGLGAEIVFTWIQKFVIRGWCPMCVGVALCVALACGIIVREHFSPANAILPGDERMSPMKRNATRAALLLVAFLAGLGTAATGLKKSEALAAGISPEALAFGPAESTRVVYIVSDWFCPACRIAEPEIIKGARLAMKQARVVFVDYPIHRETLNYIPYNLSFMLREKEKYLQIREALSGLARKTREPTPEDIQAAVAPLGVKFVPLSFSDVLQGTQYQMSVVQKLKVPGTPAVGITNTRTGKTLILNGSREITSENILRSIEEVSGP